MAISQEIQEENKKVILRFHEALNALDFDKVGELFADDAVRGRPGTERNLQGRKQIMAWLVDLLAGVKTFKVELLGLGAVGPWVADERIDWAKGEDWEGGMHVAGSYLIENGKILDWTEWVSPEDRTES